MNNTMNQTSRFKDLNEFEYSGLVAKKFKTIHHKINLSKKDYLNNWTRLIKYKRKQMVN